MSQNVTLSLQRTLSLFLLWELELGESECLGGGGKERGERARLKLQKLPRIPCLGRRNIFPSIQGLISKPKEQHMKKSLFLSIPHKHFPGVRWSGLDWRAEMSFRLLELLSPRFQL